MDSSKLPELPLITGRLVSEAFSHKSLYLGRDLETSTDNQRLAELGRTMLELIVTQYLHSRRPIVAASEIPAFRHTILSSDSYEEWVSHYNLRQKLRYSQNETIDIMSPEETRDLFHAYIGAVVEGSGPQVAIEWISQLISVKPVEIHSPIDTHRSVGHQETMKRSVEIKLHMRPPVVMTSESCFTLAREDHETARIGNTESVAAKRGRMQDNSDHSHLVATQKAPGFLFMLNQKCSQEGLEVEYRAKNHGRPHVPVWIIKCLINGEQKGEGKGSSKQVAKESAARQAHLAMGWGF